MQGHVQGSVERHCDLVNKFQKSLKQKKVPNSKMSKHVQKHIIFFLKKEKRKMKKKGEKRTVENQKMKKNIVYTIK